MRWQMILSALIIMACFVRAGSSLADGAIAVGIAPGGVAQGYAVGFGLDSPDAKTAGEKAIRACQKSREGENPDRTIVDTATSRCQVVATFRNKCVASALDPKNGTPGAGWAIAETQSDADAAALSKCRSTAGTARKSFCVVTDRHCDGAAH